MSLNVETTQFGIATITNNLQANKKDQVLYAIQRDAYTKYFPHACGK